MHLDLPLSEGQPRSSPPAPISPLLAGQVPATASGGTPGPATARGLVDADLPVPGTPAPADSDGTALRGWVTVVAGATDPCLLLNAAGLVTACAPAAIELLGLPEPAAMVGRGLLDGLLHPVDFTAAGDRLADWELAKLPPLAALATGALSRGLLRLRRRSAVQTVDAIATPLHHHASLIGSLTFFHPI
ncbi:PAS domain-containing protein [Actinocatenispora thailandica]|uniref:PAS domain-containing protein n=1 Tax=Actinocatenispora thailandica TaxID=227318 RepID=UPI0031D0BDF7